MTTKLRNYNKKKKKEGKKRRGESNRGRLPLHTLDDDRKGAGPGILLLKHPHPRLGRLLPVTPHPLPDLALPRRHVLGNEIVLIFSLRTVPKPLSTKGLDVALKCGPVRFQKHPAQYYTLLNSAQVPKPIKHPRHILANAIVLMFSFSTKKLSTKALDRR
jgi:hypothetical protein